MNFRPNKSWLLLGVGMMLGAGSALAANAGYDEAKTSITKALAHLGAITPAPNEKPGEAFQRKRAIRALERAKIRIACAQAIADGGKPGCPGARDRFDDNDDDDHDHDHHGGPKGKEAEEKQKKEAAEKQKKEAAEKQKKEAEEKQKKEAAEKQKKK